jgi:hypothetical protein
MKKLSVVSFICLFIMINACNKDEEAKGTDKELLEMAMVSSGFTWYKHSGDFLDKSSGSGHPFPILRTRFNEIAATQLDSVGKISASAVFPEGSLIVKELAESDEVVVRYAILYKDSNHNDADANGWVWGYVNLDGTVSSPAANKGGSCIGCHTQEGNIEYMLMNKFFP